LCSESPERIDSRKPKKHSLAGIYTFYKLKSFRAHSIFAETSMHYVSAEIIVSLNFLKQIFFLSAWIFRYTRKKVAQKFKVWFNTVDKLWNFDGRFYKKSNKRKEKYMVTLFDYRCY